MNFEYELRYVNDTSLVIEIKPNSLIKGDYSLLSICLMEDIKDYELGLNHIEEVLAGKIPSHHCGGNMMIAEFDKEQTEIYCCVADTPERCFLPTWLFREIVEEWIKVYKKHFEETHKD